MMTTEAISKSSPAGSQSKSKCSKSGPLGPDVAIILGLFRFLATQCALQ